MVKVYLHAGLPKTGTTTIQNWLVEYAAKLRAHGIFTFAQTELGHRLAVEGIEIAERKAQADIAAILKWRIEDVRAALKEAAEDETVTRIVISSEYLSVAEPARIRQFLAELALDDLTVIFLLRRQDRIIESGYNQDIRSMGATRPIGAAGYHPVFDWHLLASAWAKVFSSRNLSLHLYETIVSNGIPIVAQLFAKIDPEIADLAIAHPPQDERSNQSLPSALIEFKRLANRAGVTRILDLLENASQLGIGGPPFRMRRELAKAFLDYYRESNREVAKVYFGRDSDLFDESDLDQESDGADYTGELPFGTVVELLALQMQTERDRARGENKRFAQYLTEIGKAKAEIGRLGETLGVTAKGIAETIQSEAQRLEQTVRDASLRSEQHALAETDRLKQDMLREVQALRLEAETARDRTQAAIEATRQQATAEVERLGAILDAQAKVIDRLEETTSPSRLIRRWWRNFTASFSGR